MRVAPVLLAATLAACGNGAQDALEALYYVDSAQLVCNTKPFIFSVDVPTESSAKSQVHVPVFFRTFRDEVKLMWSLVDANGTIIVPATETTLQGHSRRLAEEEWLFEDFFLADGRSPVELPDSWEEARGAFRSIGEQGGSPGCEASESRLFSGRPSGREAFEPSGDFCSVLARYHAEFGGYSFSRRLKGGGGTYWSRTGSVAIGGWESTSRTSMSPYGYSRWRADLVYPRGYAKTGYGYTARGAMAPWRTRSTLAIVAGAGAGAYTGYAAWRWSRHVGAGPGECRRADSDCGWDHSGELIRDDIMTNGVIPSELRYPLNLSVTYMSSAGFVKSEMCLGDSLLWNSSSSGDLFFTLAEVDELEEDERKNNFSFLFILGCICPAAIWYLYCQGPAEWSRIMRRWKRERKGAAGLPGATTYLRTDHLVFVGRCHGSTDATYDLRFADDGAVSGTSQKTIDDRTRTIAGKVTDWENPFASLRWIETEPASSLVFEVRARICISDKRPFLHGKWFAGRVEDPRCCECLETCMGEMFCVAVGLEAEVAEPWTSLYFVGRPAETVESVRSE